MFEESLVIGASSSFSPTETINSSIETSDLITPNPTFARFASVSNSISSLDNNFVASQSFVENSQTANKNQVQSIVDSLTGILKTELHAGSGLYSTGQDNAGSNLNSARNLGTLNGRTQASDFVSGSDSNDYYRFNLSASSNFNVRIDGLNANANIQLLNSNGQALESSSETGTTAESIVRTLNAGTYYVRVFSVNGTNTDYNINLTEDSAGNAIANARHLGTLDGTQTLKDFIGTSDSNDYYRFTFANKSEFNLALNGLNADADVQLLDRNGKVIAESLQSGTTSESISSTLNVGEYVVRVLPYGNINTNYNLKLTATPLITSDALNSQWYALNFRDDEIRDLTQNLASDRQLNRNELISIFRVAKDGSIISADELRDLRLLVSNASAFNLSDHVSVLANKVVNGNAANQNYRGQALGNLSAGSSGIHMENLIAKWFLGSDRPTTLNNSHTYRQVNGSLFQNGISAEDIRQGRLGNCYFLATLSSIAQEKPARIQNMFLDNNDGTFTVRFFNNGVADYVTVDRFLPTDASGNLVYASIGLSAINAANELWVALAEKAYAQLAESGWSRRSSEDAKNSYAAIAGGWMDAVMEQVTALNTAESSAVSMAKQQAIALVNSSKLLTAGFINLDSQKNNFGIVNNHAYAITSYNATTGKFRLRNPWAKQHADLTWEQLTSLKAIIQWTNA